MDNPCYTLIVWNLRNIIRYLSWLTRRNQEFELKPVYRGYKLTKRPHHWAKNPNECEVKWNFQRNVANA